MCPWQRPTPSIRGRCSRPFHRKANNGACSSKTRRPSVSCASPFVPGEAQCYACQNVGDFKAFIAVWVKKTFVMTFNAGWHKQLGFQTSLAGSYEV